ncbi:TetR/AcrR family transcriptional regulator [Pseudarthrobacter sp. J47]|uniref:TetR/AcrR family transcriptional regulator n=1 Tax=Pseudarthrobacter sp. J47 TaxID=3116482 RepID=UPI002E80B33C|nr:TetR/AcrR family transcriptional regulator [Pseudarthrobacter sp. J47]MEE2522417.1 TetR/AcrR family transcriptional regulator [Pseudarthrobacter sp. J47]
MTDSSAATATAGPATAAPATAAPGTRRRPARDALLEAAARRFYADGLAGTGIDAITAEAGVAKKSLYNNFASKAELVSAYLDARHQEWLELYRARLAKAGNPKERVLAVFDAYADHANFAYSHGFRGCGLLNAAAELPVGDPGREAVRRHKEEVEALLAGHVAEALKQSPRETAAMAHHLAFLLEGSMVRAGLEGNDRCIREARRIAAAMLEAR